MNTRKCFDRLAKVGVEVDGLCCDGESFYHYGWDGRTKDLPEHLAELMLEAQVLRKHPEFCVVEINTVRNGKNEVTYFVEYGDVKYDGEQTGAPTRLAALTLAAERGAKEKA